jgi:hypothetical protein
MTFRRRFGRFRPTESGQALCPHSILPTAFPQTVPRPSPPPVQFRDHAIRRDHRRNHAAIRRHEEVVARTAGRQARRWPSIPQAVERTELRVADQCCDLMHRDFPVQPALRAMPPNLRFWLGQNGGNGLAPGRRPRVRHRLFTRSTPTHCDKNGKRTNGKSASVMGWGQCPRGSALTDGEPLRPHRRDDLRRVPRHVQPVRPFIGFEDDRCPGVIVFEPTR